MTPAVSPVAAVRALKVRPERATELPEHLAVEEPMEIRAAGAGQEPAPVAVTMRTPGHDFELAAGFLYTEGVITASDIAAVAYCDAPGGADRNSVTVRLRCGFHPKRPPRAFVAGASCGVCGKASIEELELSCEPVGVADPVPAALAADLPERLRSSQTAFDRTGGLHAAGLFSPTGDLAVAREDVGRHNAVDKVAGWTVLTDGPTRYELAGWVLAVSGRVSFEIVQKAAMAGVGTVAAVSAPSSLAVQAAQRLGVAVLGFVRNGCFNIYTHPARISLPG